MADPDWWDDAWLDARTDAAKKTGIGFDVFPPTCPRAATAVLEDNWLPN
jgi:hypothetical protein